MIFTEGLRSSATDNWATPQHVFDALDKEFGFQLDVCADESNAKCDSYFTREDNGLEQEWVGVCWMNPPYGREIGAWVRKAYESSRQGAVVVCLLPARTDTRWWRDYVMRATELRFVSGRLKFGDADTGAPFPSVVAVFGTTAYPRMSYISFNGGGEWINGVIVRYVLCVTQSLLIVSPMAVTIFLGRVWWLDAYLCVLVPVLLAFAWMTSRIDPLTGAFEGGGRPHHRRTLKKPR